MALPRHDAALGDQENGAQPDGLGAEGEGFDRVHARLNTPVDDQLDPVPQVVRLQHLVRGLHAQLPGQPGKLDRAERGGAGAAGVAGDVHRLCSPLGHARGDDGDARLAHQLHVAARRGVELGQLIHQLGQVFDRVNVVVRGRRDELDAAVGAGRPRQAWSPGPS